MKTQPWLVEERCESCGRRCPTVTVSDGSSVFEVCSSCASDAVDHGWTLEVSA